MINAVIPSCKIVCQWVILIFFPEFKEGNRTKEKRIYGGLETRVLDGQRSSSPVVPKLWVTT